MKNNGPIVATFFAAGFASLVFGVIVILGEILGSSYFVAVENVGPLSGEVAVAVGTYITTWIILHMYLHKKDLPLGKVFIVTMLMIATSIILTFPPVFTRFAS